MEPSEDDIDRSSAHDDEKPQEGVTLHAKETRLVNRSKIFVYVFLFLAAGVFGAIAYSFLEQQETRWWRDEYEEFAEEVFKTSAAKLANTQDALAGFADAITSHVGTTGVSDKPLNVTLPDFGIHAKHVLGIANSDLILYAPLVQPWERNQFEQYAAAEQGWISQDLSHVTGDSELPETGPIPEKIYDVEDDNDNSLLLPVWQLAPVPRSVASSPIMLNLNSISWLQPHIQEVLEQKVASMTLVYDITMLLDYLKDQDGSDDEEENEGGHGKQESPHSIVLQPVFSSFDGDDVMGVIVAALSWGEVFDDILEDDEAGGLYVDLDVYASETRTSYTFHISSEGETEFDGNNFVHDLKYESDIHREKTVLAAVSDEEEDDEDHEGSSDSSDLSSHELESELDGLYVSVHASDEFVENWHRSDPEIFTAIAVAIFFFVSLVFCIYDWMVQIRQKKVLDTAEKSTAIVESLFPKNVTQQLMNGTNADHKKPKNVSQVFTDFAQGGELEMDIMSKPIADLFPETTIMFADLVGFTAWSSSRGPTNVFHLLETIFSAFDAIADKRGVFKIVGDCYVAVCGLPEPRADHATVMVRFAMDCLYKISALTQQLEVSLGPDTAELGMRVGLHSGPVTAGVLRGNRPRFQLFGDSMNTASRIETTGAKGRIHVSQSTCDLLVASGKKHWVTQRTDTVVAKGKGKLITYWVNVKGASAPSDERTEPSSSNTLTSAELLLPTEKLSAKETNLAKWAGETLNFYLRKVVGSRSKQTAPPSSTGSVQALEKGYMNSTTIVFNEAKDVIDFNPIITPVSSEEVQEVVLESSVSLQLQQYVRAVIGLYPKHAFHSSEHAGHVVMSTTKLLSRMVPIHENSEVLFGPLTEFAVVLAALIHDLDHPGVSNSTLVEEKHPLVAKYGNKSIAEQNSFDQAWTLLMEPAFAELRSCIYETTDELAFFRQILVNTVMATDIMDSDLAKRRTARWKRAFGEKKAPKNVDLNLQKTVILEHLLQASDVAHTMQHWLVYQTHNKRLFEEMRTAFLLGRTDKDPSEYWYEGEISFFTFYIVPLAKKLKDCQAFGVSSYEYLDYAEQNQTEWKSRGHDIVLGLTGPVRSIKGTIDESEEYHI